MPRARLLVGPAVLLLLEGCKGCVSEEALPTYLSPVDATATGVWVADAVAVGDVAVPLVTTSAAGAPITTSDAVAVGSSGNLSSGSVSVDADGWGEAVVTSDVPGGYSVDATTTTGAASGSAWSVRAQPGRLDWLGWTPAAPARQAAVAGGGAVWASGSEVYWAPAAGGTPVRVGDLGADVDGLLAVQADNDGVTDLLAWSTTTVVLFRGRDAGGLYQGGAWAAEAGASISAATVADFTGDALGDLVVYTNLDGGAGAVSILEGDGVWGYTLADVLPLDFAAYGVSVEDLDGDGDAEVTVLTEDGILRRFARFEEGWSATTTGADLSPDIGPGGRLWPSSDVDGDGIVDLIVPGPMIDGSGQQAWVVTAGADRQILYMMFDGALPDELGVVVADLTGDNLVDLAFSSDQGFARTAWTVNDDHPDGAFVKQIWSSVPVGALGAGDLDGDGIADVVVAGEHVVVVPGDRVEDDATTADVDETVAWQPRPSTSLRLGNGNEADPALGDLNGDGIVDAVLLTGTSGNVVLRGYAGSPATDVAEETFVSGGDIDLGGDVGLGVAVCGTRAWALVEDSGTGAVTLWSAELDADLGPTQALDPVSIDGGALLTCGAFADGDAAVVSSGGVVTFVSARDGAVVQGASMDGAASIAAADEDGDGVDELVGCTEAGCRVVAGDLDGDGVDEVATYTPTAGNTVRVAGVEQALPGAGLPVIGDADGDGYPDLVLADAGVTQVHRLLDGAVSPAETSFVWRPVSDRVAYGDLSGDGVPDAFFFGVDPDTTDAEDVWSGTLIYAEATASE